MLKFRKLLNCTKPMPAFFILTTIAIAVFAHWLALSVPLTALSVAGLCNAYNMIDGIDGLAATTLLLPLAVLFGLATAGQHPMSNALILIIVPLCIFLIFNLGPNNRLLPKMFLGDGAV